MPSAVAFTSWSVSVHVRIDVHSNLSIKDLRNKDTTIINYQDTCVDPRVSIIERLVDTCILGFTVEYKWHLGTINI